MPPHTTSTSVQLSETNADLMGLVEGDFYDIGEEGGTVGFLCHSEIKDGCVAMGAFVGYVVQSNFIFPWPQHMDGTTGPPIDLSPEQQGMLIFTLVAFLEIWGE